MLVDSEDMIHARELDQRAHRALRDCSTRESGTRPTSHEGNIVVGRGQWYDLYNVRGGMREDYPFRLTSIVIERQPHN